MKKQLTLAAAAFVTLLILPACTTVETAPEPRTHTSTTSTTETSMHRAAPSSVESTTVRSY